MNGGVDLSVMRDAHFVVSPMLMLCSMGGAVRVVHDAHLCRTFYARDMYVGYRCEDHA